MSERALAKVLADEHFAAVGAQQLATTEGFVRAIRSAPHQSITALHRWLEELAFETEDYGEASGVLVQVAAFGGGLLDVPSDHDVPLADHDALAARIIACPSAERRDLYMAVLDGLARDNATATLTPLQRHRALSLAHYGAAPVSHVRWPDTTATWDAALTWAEQYLPSTWEVFTSRPAAEVADLTAAWWGDPRREPQDFAIALRLEDQGHISLAAGAAYDDATLEHLLWRWHGAGAAALTAHPRLADAAHRALDNPKGVLWLASEQPADMAANLDGLFDAGLERAVVCAAIDALLASRKGGQARPHLAALRAQL